MKAPSPLRRTPRDPALQAVRQDARLQVRVAEAWTREPDGWGQIDPAPLVAIADDERIPASTRRRAAALLVRLPG